MKIYYFVLIIGALVLSSCTEKYYNEWVERNGNKYYYDENGNMVRDKLCNINGNYYYFYESGEMAKNKQCEIDGSIYHFGGTGMARVGFAGTVYYDDKGRLVTNKVVHYGGEDWLAGKDGQFVRNGWYDCNGSWYYVKNFALKKGWVEDEGSWYYLNPETYIMCKNQWIDDNYYVGNDGKMLVNTVKEMGDKTYMFDANGKATQQKSLYHQVLQKDGYKIIVENFPNPLWANDCYIRINDLRFEIESIGRSALINYETDIQILQTEYRNDNTLWLYYRIYDEANYEIDSSFISIATNEIGKDKKSMKKKGHVYISTGDTPGTYRMVIYSLNDTY